MNKKAQFIHVPQTAFRRLKYLSFINQDFTLAETGSSQLIRYKHYRFFYGASVVKRKHMHLFQDIKKHVKSQIEKNQIEVEPIERLKPLYFKFRELNLEPGECQHFDNVCQYDVNKAYYTVARNMGFISEEYFNKYLSLPKHMRLILIGALATRKTIKTYEKGKLVEKELKEDQELRTVFMRIVIETDKVLLQMSKALKDEFLFYWVDGITVKDTKKAADVVSYYSSRYNLEFSKDPLKFVRMEQREQLTAIVNTGTKEKILMNRKIFK